MKIKPLRRSKRAKEGKNIFSTHRWGFAAKIDPLHSSRAKTKR